MSSTLKATYFQTASAFRDWLERNPNRASELWVGFHKTGSGKGGMTYRQALDAALCFGWIDGRRQRVDAHNYRIRFTPRRPGSIWSLVNTRRARQLEQLGQMRPAGLAALRARDPRRSGIYSFESSARKLGTSQQGELLRNRQAWTFFKTQPPWYQRTASFWVMSAKKPETTARRLALLIQHSEMGERVPPLRYSGKS